MSDQLKPCPFCGGKAELWMAHAERTAWIACMSKCSVLVSKEYKTDAEAIAAWNRRAIPAAQPSPDVEALVEALEKLVHAVCGETGFAQSVRDCSGFAYPWPALDEAELIARAAIARVKGGDA